MRRLFLADRFNLSFVSKLGRHPIVLVVCLSVLLRVLYLLQMMDNPFLSHPRLDALFHDNWALSVANGNFVGNDVFFRAPLYPYLLGLVYAVFGHDYLIVRILQHALGVLSCLLVFLLSRKWFDTKVSTLAALLVAANPMLIYFEGQLLFESFLVCLCLLWLLFVFRAGTTHLRRDWIITGVLLGLLGITRPPFLAVGVLLVAFVSWKYLNTSRRVRLMMVVYPFAIGVLLIILPVTLRNYIVGDDFVFIASQGGVNFYIGNNAEADGISSSMPGHLRASWENRDQTHFVETQIGHKPKPSEESAFWYARSFEFITSNPLSFVALLFKKMYLFWNHLEIPNNLDYNSFKSYTPILEYNPFGFGLIGPFALFGFLLVLRRVGSAAGLWQARTLMAFVFLYFFSTVIFFVCDRYRVPAVPVLSIFASYGLFLLIDKIRQRSYMKLGYALGVLGILALFVNSTLYTIDTRSEARDKFTLGIIALNENRAEDAIQHFRSALELNPSLPYLRHNLGVAESMRGEMNLAVEWFHQELGLNSKFFGSLISLARIHLEQREIDLAIHYANAAIESKPYLPSGYTVLVKAQLLQGRMGEADSLLKHASTLCDANEFVYGTYLQASINQDQGRLQVSEAQYRSVLDRITRMSNTQPLYEPEFSFNIDEKVGEQLEIVQAKSCYGLGLIFLAKGLADSAVTYFMTATALDPLFGNAYADLGVTLLRLRRVIEAEAALSKAVKLNPEHFLYWFNYGNVLAFQGKLVEANRAFEKSLSLKDDFLPAKERITHLARIIGE